VIRNYQKGDEKRMAEIFSECFGPVTPRRVLQWKRRSGRKPEEIFVGTVDGKLVSHVEAGVQQLHQGEGVFLRTVGIGGVCTDSDCRNKGIVTNLMKIALDRARLEGVSNASLFTDLDIPAHRIYQRFGFVDIVTARTYIKYIDYPSIFAKWLRYCNRLVKADKIAARRLQGWEKSVAVQLRDVGTLSFRVRKNRFQRVRRPSEQADIEFSTDLLTYTKIMRGLVKWEDVVKASKLRVKRGYPADIEMLNRILNWRWHD
jgi:predicted N-acetyltransferase YhbS